MEMDDFGNPIEPVRFVDLPESVVNMGGPKVEAKYQMARQKMYRAQLEAAVIAAKVCWPKDYRAAELEFQRKLLDLFSQTCTSYNRARPA